MNMNGLLILAVIASAALSLVTNEAIRSLARNEGWTAGPRSSRHIHRKPIPRLGGVGIFVSTVLVTAALALLWPVLLPSASLLKLFAPATVMFAVGLWDDFHPLSAKLKLLFQIASAIALFAWIRQTPMGMSFAEGKSGPIILLIATIAWVVAVSNSINLIDGIDGLAGGTVALSLAAIAFVAVTSSQWDVVILAAVLIGSIAGFLRFNVNPATLFLGDGGSLFLGYMISALGISWSGSRALAGTMVVSVAILALPLAETGVSVSRRFLSGHPIFTPDREHIHHKLLDRGFSQRKAALMLHAVTVVCGLAGIGIASGNFGVRAVSCAILLTVLTIGVFALGYVEFRELGRSLKQISQQRRVLANNVALRKIAGRVRQAQCLGMVADELQAALRNMDFDGFQLIVSSSAMNSVARCSMRSENTKWGYILETRPIDPACFRVGFDLISRKEEKIGWVVLERKLDHGSILFDPNVLLTELLPAIAASMEPCLNSSCTRFQLRMGPNYSKAGTQDATVRKVSAPKVSAGSRSV